MLDQADQEVTVETHISTSDGGAHGSRQQGKLACGAGGVAAMQLTPAYSADSLVSEGIRAFWCYEI